MPVAMRSRFTSLSDSHEALTAAAEVVLQVVVEVELHDSLSYQELLTLTLREKTRCASQRSSASFASMEERKRAQIAAPLASSIRRMRTDVPLREL